MGSYLTALYLIHDLGHQEVFSTKKLNQQVNKWVAILFLNVSTVNETMEIHDEHHCFPNVLDRDHTLTTGPFKWHEEQTGGNPLSPLYSLLAPLFWYGLALFMYNIVEYKLSLERNIKVGVTPFGLAIARVFAVFMIPMYFQCKFNTLLIGDYGGQETMANSAFLLFSLNHGTLR